jgi:hypothetical protein
MTASLDEQIAAAEGTEQSKTDEYYAREKVIETLTNVLQRQRTEPVYIEPQVQTKPTNYVMYIGVGIAAFLLLRK